MRGSAKRVMMEARILLRALRDPRTPMSARLIALGIVLYIVSPFDLIPDYVPLIGLLDDLLVAAIGVVVILRLIPAEVMAQFRPPPPANDNGGVPHRGPLLPLLVALIGVLALTLAAWWGYGYLAAALRPPAVPL
jgi:hypothetical protein